MSPKSKEQNEVIRQQSQANIMEAAFELFAKNTYHNTSISQIAKAAGVSKGLIYNYFSSKEHLLEEIIMQAVVTGEEMMHHILQSDAAPKDKLKNLLNAGFAMIEGNLHYWKLMTSLSMQEEVQSNIYKKLKKRHETQLALIVNLLEQMGEKEPKMRAFFIGATMDGVLFGLSAMGDDYPLKDMKDYLLKQFLPES